MLNHRLGDLLFHHTSISSILAFSFRNPSCIAYRLHNTRAKDINNTSETIKVSFILLVKMENVTSDDVLNFRALHKAKFGLFFAAILSLLFSPYICPVLQCNNVTYFAGSFALIW